MSLTTRNAHRCAPDFENLGIRTLGHCEFILLSAVSYQKPKSGEGGGEDKSGDQGRRVCCLFGGVKGLITGQRWTEG